MSAYFSDDFSSLTGTQTLTSSTPQIGTGWIADNQHFRLRNGRVASAGAFTRNTIQDASASADYDVEATFFIKDAATIATTGIFGRHTANNSRLTVVIPGSGDRFSLFQHHPTLGFSTLGQWLTPVNTNDSFQVKLELRGTTAKVYVDGVERISATVDITAVGTAGVYGETDNFTGDNGVHLDNFVASNPDAAAGGDGDATLGLPALGASSVADYAPPATPQIAHPSADQATGAWTPTPLWSRLGAADGTAITSDNNTAPDNADLKLAVLDDPQTSAGHILRVRWHKDAAGGHAVNAVLELWQGVPGVGALVKALTVVGISEVALDSEITLSAGEADAITDYGDLYVRLSRQGESGGGPSGRRALVVDFVEMEAPPAPAQGGTGDATLALGALGGSAGATYVDPPPQGGAGSLSAGLAALGFSASDTDVLGAGELRLPGLSLSASGGHSGTIQGGTGDATLALGALGVLGAGDYNPRDPDGSLSAALGALSLGGAAGYTDGTPPQGGDGSAVLALAAVGAGGSGDFSADPPPPPPPNPGRGTQRLGLGIRLGL